MEKNKDVFDSIFFSTFVGELVEVVGTSGGEKIGLKGFLLHMDDEYVYLGPDQEKITTAVKKSSIDIIGIEGEMDEVSELLSEMANPKREEEIN